MDQGHDDAASAGATGGNSGNNSAEQFQPEPQAPQISDLGAGASAPTQPADSPQFNAAPQTTPQGIFSSPDLAVNSENLEDIKPELSDENKSRIASAFAMTDATQKHDQLADQMASQDQDAVSGTVLPAGVGGFGSNSTASTATGDIRMPGAKKKSKLPLILLALVVLAAVGGGVAWMLLRGDKKIENEEGAIGAVNTTIVFDQTAPIPAIFGNSYGYISPEDGSQIIGARFLEAERFYGEYAIAKTGTNDIIDNTLIINRAGEAIFTIDGDAAATYYDIENNLWMVDGDAYNTNMQKLSPTDTKGQYIGNGYLLVTSEAESATPVESQNNSDEPENDDDGGDSGSSSGSSDDVQGSTLASGSIYNLNGKEIYNCETYCSASTLKVDKTVYGIIRLWGQYSQVINLSTNEIIYKTTGGTLALQDDGLVERDNGNTVFLKIENNQLVKVPQLEAAQATVSGAGEYVVDVCTDDNKYSIKSIDGRIVSNCDIENYYELPTNLYLAYSVKFKKSPILVVKNEELQLINMNDTQVMKTYRGQGAVMFEDSPFLYLQNLMNNESTVCNLLGDGDDICQSLGNDNPTVEGYGNYFTTSGSSEHIYNAALKEIR